MSEQLLNNDEMDAVTGGTSFRAHHQAIPQDPTRFIPQEPMILVGPIRALFRI